MYHHRNACNHQFSHVTFCIEQKQFLSVTNVKSFILTFSSRLNTKKTHLKYCLIQRKNITSILKQSSSLIRANRCNEAPYSNNNSTNVTAFKLIALSRHISSSSF